MFKAFKKHPENTDPVKMEMTIGNRTVIRVLVIIFAFLLGLAAVQQASQALFMLFVAFFLALALNGPVQGIAKRLPGKMRGKRSVATSISFLIVVLAIAGFIALMVPPLIKQTQNFISSVPSLVESAHDQDSTLGSTIRRYNLQGQLDNLSSDLSDRVKGLGGAAVNTIGKVGTSIVTTLTILVLTFMMLIEGPKILEFGRELVPKRNRKNVDRLAKDMYRVVKGYVNGQVTLAAIASVALIPALLFLKIDYPFALVVIVFICGLIPMVGHTIGAIIVTLVALATSPFAAIAILGYYFLYQQIENYLVQPRIQANSTNMSPLLVFASVVVGVSFGGLFGGLFAIPVAGCIRILVLDYLASNNYIADPDRPVITETVKDAKTSHTV